MEADIDDIAKTIDEHLHITWDGVTTYRMPPTVGDALWQIAISLDKIAKSLTKENG